MLSNMDDHHIAPQMKENRAFVLKFWAANLHTMLSLNVNIVSYDVEDGSCGGLHVEDGSYWMLSAIWASW